jgi:hypothetical protein
VVVGGKIILGRILVSRLEDRKCSGYHLNRRVEMHQVESVCGSGISVNVRLKMCVIGLPLFCNEVLFG